MNDDFFKKNLNFFHAPFDTHDKGEKKVQMEEHSLKIYSVLDQSFARRRRTANRILETPAGVTCRTPNGKDAA
ncbi:hypothetical protein [Desulfobulbus propionicus]|jgi:hypothetical protein